MDAEREEEGEGEILGFYDVEDVLVCKSIHIPKKIKKLSNLMKHGRREEKRD